MCDWRNRNSNRWLRLSEVTRNNLHDLDVAFPLSILTTVTDISGSGKSSLVSQVLVDLVAADLGHKIQGDDEGAAEAEHGPSEPSGGRITSGMESVKRLVRIDQKPIGRTPRSNLATYTGLFNHVRRLFALTKTVRARKYDAGRFSFNVAAGRCETCSGKGFVFVELLFLPSVYAQCPTCHGARYNAKTLEVKYRDQNIAEVLGFTVDKAWEFFMDEPPLRHALTVLRNAGLGYLRLGQPATELSGGEAQRIKLATELQRQQRGHNLYVLDEPKTGLHSSDVERLFIQLNALVDAGNTVIVVEHDLHVVAGSDWVIDMGSGAGEEGGRIIFAGPPKQLSKVKESLTGKYLKRTI